MYLFFLKHYLVGQGMINMFIFYLLICYHFHSFIHSFIHSFTSYFVLVIPYSISEDSKLHDWLATTYFPERVTIITYRLRHKGVFPINTLRNLGIKHIRTTHYMVLDIDLMVSSMLCFISLIYVNYYY